MHDVIRELSPRKNRINNISHALNIYGCSASRTPAEGGFLEATQVTGIFHMHQRGVHLYLWETE